MSLMVEASSCTRKSLVKRLGFRFRTSLNLSPKASKSKVSLGGNVFLTPDDDRFHLL